MIWVWKHKLWRILLKVRIKILKITEVTSPVKTSSFYEFTNPLLT